MRLRLAGVAALSLALLLSMHLASGGAVPPPPAFGKSVLLDPTGDGAEVAAAPGKPFSPLRRERRVALGAVILPTAPVLITAMGADGSPQHATISGDAAQILQPQGRARGITVLRLKGGGFRNCTRPGPSGRAEPSRSLTIHVRGPWRTIGRVASATAKGTVWTMTDTCSGTLTEVAAGHVEVHDFVRHRLVELSKGGSYMARG
jgi:hypothetical protein